MTHGFEIVAQQGELARAGVIHTPHGDIPTPAFIPVGTKATVKSLVPEQVRDLGAKAVLANAYHLYLQPGPELVDRAGGVAKFMNWDGPTYTDSGGFQVLSLGAGYKKVLSQEFAGGSGINQEADSVAPAPSGTLTGQDGSAAAHNHSGDKRRALEDTEEDAQLSANPRQPGLARVDEDGVNFRSHLDGSKHRFTPEVSMQIQHHLGADIIFAFDELTSLVHPYEYQVESLERTRRWAQRCLAEHRRLTQLRADKPYQMLFGVVQGAQWEDLRRKAARDLGQMEIEGQRFDGFGIGGALEAGADTFDCVSPSRVARTGAAYLSTGRMNMARAAFRGDFSAVEPECGCYTCTHYSRAYIHHLLKAKEMLASTLLTIHNEYYTVKLCANIRAALIAGPQAYRDFKTQTLSRLGRL